MVVNLSQSISDCQNKMAKVTYGKVKYDDRRMISRQGYLDPAPAYSKAKSISGILSATLLLHEGTCTPVLHGDLSGSWHLIFFGEERNLSR